MSDFETRVFDQIRLLNAGDPLGALKAYYATNCRLYDNDQLFAQGKVQAREKQEPFIKAAAQIEGRIEDLALSESRQLSVFRNCSSFTTMEGKKIQINGVHLQRWSEGSIVEEHYYRDTLLEKKLGDGLLGL